jgi:beta-glucosidase
VKYWVTFNDPARAAVMGHDSGEHAPGRRVSPSREVYLAAHNMLLAHGRAYAAYQ